MAEAARSFDLSPASPAVPAVANWSGEVHGPVAALHQAIEAGLAGSPLDAGYAAEAASPVDRLLRTGSRLIGWAALAAAFAATATAIF